MEIAPSRQLWKTYSNNHRYLPISMNSRCEPGTTATRAAHPLNALRMDLVMAPARAISPHPSVPHAVRGGFQPQYKVQPHKVLRLDQVQAHTTAY